MDLCGGVRAVRVLAFWFAPGQPQGQGGEHAVQLIFDSERFKPLLRGDMELIKFKIAFHLGQENSVGCDVGDLVDNILQALAQVMVTSTGRCNCCVMATGSNIIECCGLHFPQFIVLHDQFRYKW